MQIDSEMYFFLEWCIIKKQMTEEDFGNLSTVELYDLSVEYTTFKEGLK